MRKVTCVLLCEDKTQDVFLRNVLNGLGISKRSIRVQMAPPGQGAAEQYVRINYPVEVREYRKRNPAHWGLVVAIDADTGTVETRFRQLASELDSNGLDPRRDNERIALMIPRRNIETWIYYLLGNSDVSESEDYKSKYRRTPENRICRPAAARLLDLLRSTDPDPEDCPDSLTIGIAELRRLG